ncbi:membrane-associated HD superfamily hydrolase [Legionella steigerwaltii]|uniref:Membrane-associated HD superfamily hydrolase n=1 Tax=Legionella steigerwaltii TaxID=460 RepID=A0A378LGF0_9GAMM|nr:hypothetical protein [Legionella steigerwaltii]KTD80128.1 membrane-associated HD superfamily hydrolase [Legionella steigerwaltii]STY23151.1 membrane-associated HD superfamily hydrolase [Legionella steigerwaltii]
MADTNEFDEKMAEAKESEIKGAEQLRKDANQKAFEQRLTAAQLKAQREWAKFMDEIRQAGRIKGAREGQPQTYWEEVQQAADYAIAQDQNSTIDWRSSMISLLNMLAKLNKAINISVKQTGAEVVDFAKRKSRNSALGVLFHPDEMIYQHLKAAILHRIKGDGELNIPLLQQKVTFKDGKVNVADLTRADGIDLDKNHLANQALKKFVNLWLEENGYVYDPQEKTHVKYNPGSTVPIRLDEATFNDLNRPDSEKNFAKFLEANAALKYGPQSEERSTPTPP